MNLSRSARRFRAGIAGGLLLFCQSAIAVHSCALGATGSENNAAHQPCHETAAGSGSSTDHEVCQAHCLSSQAMPASAKFAAYAATDLAAPTARLDQPLSSAACAASIVASRTADVESPPLIIIHCRLRN